VVKKNKAPKLKEARMLNHGNLLVIPVDEATKKTLEELYGKGFKIKR
jgi:hypothetical protein